MQLGQLVQLGLPCLKYSYTLRDTVAGDGAGRMYTQPSIVIFLGPPGCGKGTQAARLSSELQIPAISTGEILRQACQSGSELGKSVRVVLESGQLVGDDLMNQVVSQRLLEPDCADGCILDGYPRTVAQASFLSAWLATHGLPSPIILDFHLSDSKIVTRLSRRRVCGQCSRVYGAGADTGKPQVRCEADGARLLQRADDRPEVIRARLRVYKTNADQLVQYYQAGNYFRIPAAGSPDEVASELQALAFGSTLVTVARRNQVTARPAYTV
jgi:adenylate kinase